MRHILLILALILKIYRSKWRVYILITVLPLLLETSIDSRGADPIPNTSQISLIHGEEELNRFLSDRPQLQSIVQYGNPIWMWLRAGFGNESTGVVLLWENKPTASYNTFGTEIRFSVEEKKAYIRVDRFYREGRLARRERSAEDLLEGIVFELCNADNYAHALELNKQIYAGKISKREFILALAHDEYLTSMKTGKFYREIWLPFCYFNHISMQKPSLWYYTNEETFDAWLDSFPKNSEYPWKSYGKEYDEIKETAMKTSKTISN